MPFEVFQRQRVAPSAVPYVTVHKRGTIGLSIAAWQALGDPEAVELLYDPEANVMGLRPVDADQAHAYRPRPSGRDGRVRVVSGTAFFQYYGLPLTGVRRFVGRIEDDTLIVDLNTPVTETTRPLAESKTKRLPQATQDP
jgi:hypothetical protein